MKDNKKQYWKGIEQLSNDTAFVKHANKEFPEYLPINENEGDESSRRDFLKMMGFGIAAVSLVSCEAPIRKAIPYLNKPVDVDPGVANYYASTYLNGGDYASIVVKTREGRPIKIEGNKLSGISQRGTNAQVEASILSLYDKERLTGPQKDGVASDWDTIDQEISASLESISTGSEAIRLVSNTIMSPTTLKVIEEFKAKYPTVELIQFDPQSASGILDANAENFGTRVIPGYDFSKAEVIVSFGADFLGTWISPIEYTKQYSKTRKLGKKAKMSRHFQFESNLSLTGANADYRTPIRPSQEGQAIAALYNAIAAKIGGSTVPGGSVSDYKYMEKAAADLAGAQGKSLVVSGSNDKDVQILVNGINEMLGNYGTTISLTSFSNARKGSDSEMSRLITDAGAGNVGAIIFLNCNPVYHHPRGGELGAALAKVKLTVSTSDRKDETASNVTYIAPDHHFLESWNDAEPRNGQLSLAQPTISKIFDTRQGQESLLKWAGNSTEFFDYLKSNWSGSWLAGSTGLSLQTAWDKCLQDGVLTYENIVEAPVANIDAITASNSVASNYQTDGDFELALYQKVAVGDGSMGNNPWLHETPDPITKGTWDNYVTISQADATAKGIVLKEEKTTMVNLTVNGATRAIPCIIQPGQANGTVGLALGYGRKSGGRVAKDLGVDAYPFVGTLNKNLYYANTSVSVEAHSEVYQVAQTQTHQTYMGRENVIQEAVLADYKNNPSAGRHIPYIATWANEEGKVKPGELSLWKGHKYPDHHWGLAIDLNSCTGCSACHVSCQVENNIPVVGRQEVINRRDMHWMRIDRYYSSPEGASSYKELAISAENPEVTFQPMMCQHCNNAPCETVCPVAATTHSTSGLNQMVYNRCIGTRYCANNCPYKVRRFNWFKYHDNNDFGDNLSMNNDLGKMVLNPDVTVRSRGVMEKCSFCVQRIQLGKLEAKKEGRRTNDDDVTTACASSCPSDALVFGDMNDPKSEISQFLKIKDTEGDYGIDKTIEEPRAYTVLEEVGTKPNVMYLTKIRNKDKEENNA